LATQHYSRGCGNSACPARTTPIATHRTPDHIAAFIRTRLHLGPAPGLPEIRLFRAKPTSGLSHFLGLDAPSPYWAYDWAGGTVLASHILDHPAIVRGLRVLDLGTGSGLVAIAAAKAGATSIEAVDNDPAAGVAAALNAAANAVEIKVKVEDGLRGALPAADLITVGDLFYEPALARRASRFLARCRAAGIDVLVGDPGRKPLPLHRLRKLAEALVPDFDRPGGVPAAVYQFVGAAEPRLPLSAPARSGTARDRWYRYPPGKSRGGR
jgi:predicted nicotinamide N-methyase